MTNKFRASAIVLMLLFFVTSEYGTKLYATQPNLKGHLWDSSSNDKQVQVEEDSDAFLRRFPRGLSDEDRAAFFRRFPRRPDPGEIRYMTGNDYDSGETRASRTAIIIDSTPFTPFSEPPIVLGTSLISETNRILEQLAASRMPQAFPIDAVTLLRQFHELIDFLPQFAAVPRLQDLRTAMDELAAFRSLNTSAAIPSELARRIRLAFFETHHTEHTTGIMDWLSSTVSTIATTIRGIYDLYNVTWPQ